MIIFETSEQRDEFFSVFKKIEINGIYFEWIWFF